MESQLPGSFETNNDDFLVDSENDSNDEDFFEMLAHLNDSGAAANPGAHIECSEEDFAAGRARRYGESNPQLVRNNFQLAMVRSQASAWEARHRFHANAVDDDNDDDDETWTRGDSRTTVFSFDRLGRSCTELPDGRLVFVGGAHEDSSDPDFCIYNDVVVVQPQHPGRPHTEEEVFKTAEIKMYAYPRDVFPPTDGHTATFVPHLNSIIIVGNAGYVADRQPGHTPVFRLDIKTFAISKMECTDPTERAPGWVSSHSSKLVISSNTGNPHTRYLVVGPACQQDTSDDDSDWAPVREARVFSNRAQFQRLNRQAALCLDTLEWFAANLRSRI
eukprot:INCI13286.1.p1 GENE.INCI13286.1~~INCI13286.1.p1  ORF type:complete len:332 (-),score=75.92 INCI13286.1:102-1097(-)